MYISQDPIRLRGGNNLYGYVHNPNAWIDIFGLYRNEKGQYARDPDKPEQVHNRDSEYPHSYRSGVKEEFLDSRTVRDSNGNPVLDSDGNRSFYSDRV